MAWTKSKSIVAGLALLAAVIAVILRWGCSPALQDSYFKLNYMRFQTVPANLLVIRPTHFTNDSGSFTASTTPKVGQNVMRMLGRNVPLAQIIAVAYGSNPSRIVMPFTKPKGNFDYLVTVPDRQQERLQKAIQKKLGYTARWDDRDTEVLLLETTTPDPPGFTLSASSANGNVAYKNGRYQFTHMRPAVMLGFLETSFKQPVLDRTGLTNFYDFSVAMNWRGPDGPDQQQLENILGNLGRKLVPATEATRMLVVEKIR